MDESERIDKMIGLMHELQSLCQELNDPRKDVDVIIGTIIALIICADIPDVTILPNNETEMAQA
jgi:hypothetical protein